MNKSLSVFKFEIKKLLRSKTLLVFAIVALILLITVSVVFGSLVAERPASDYHGEEALSDAEVAKYRNAAKRHHCNYLIAKMQDPNLSEDELFALGGEAYNQDVDAAYYAEQSLFYNALADHKQNVNYIVTSSVFEDPDVITYETARSYKLVKYAFMASICMIIVGMFVGIYSFGNDKMRGMKLLLSSGTDRKFVFVGQIGQNVVLIGIVWIIFLIVGLAVFAKDASASVYNLSPTRCSVTSAMGYYFGKMAFGFLAAVFASSASALTTGFSRHTGAYFVGVPILMMVGGGAFAMMWRTTSTLSLSAICSPLVGIPFLPVTAAYPVVLSLVLQMLFAGVFFFISYKRFEKQDL